MKLTKAQETDIKTTPWLKKCLDEYFAPGQMLFDRSHIVALKWRPDSCYVVILFQVGKHYYAADIAGTRSGDHYSVCNDGEDMTLEQWKGLKVDPYCDSFTLAEDRE